jgi:CRISPR-associated protein Cmr6
MARNKKKKGKKGDGVKKPVSNNAENIHRMVSISDGSKKGDSGPAKKREPRTPTPPIPASFGELPGPGRGPTNAGHYYYAGREYGRDLPAHSYPRLLGRHADRFSKKMPIHGIPHEAFFDPAFGDEKKKNRSFSLNAAILETTYPGLLIGTGYMHPVPTKVSKDKDEDGDFQQGFFFDWTTGAPVIPGSTVKGVLRSVFPKPGDAPEIREGKARYIVEVLAEISKCEAGRLGDPDSLAKKLETELFEGGNMAYFDAYIVGVPEDGKVFREDYITPHRNGPFEDPIPLRFLKIGPGVRFRFPFRLREVEIGGTTLPGGKLKEFFQRILMDFGIGAKRNTGYGALAAPKKG